MSVWLDAYVDQELDVARSVEIEAHISSCASCAASVQDRRELRNSLRRAGAYRGAPAALRSAVTESLLADLKSPKVRTKAPGWAWGSLAACFVLAGVVAWLLAMPRGVPSIEDPAVHEAVSAHIRSLMVAHLADIATSDQHTVKPWFAGKLDFSPAVVDHAAEGFPLTGGRLDYVAGRQVAAVVYQRRAHVINLFTCPDAAAKSSDPMSVQDRGYNAVTWSDGAMKFCAVSDVNGEELMKFVALVREHPVPRPDSAKGP